MKEPKVESSHPSGVAGSRISSIPQEDRSELVRNNKLKEAKTALDQAYQGQKDWPMHHGYKIGRRDVDLEPNALVVREGKIWTKYTFNADGQCSKVERRDETNVDTRYQEVNEKERAGLKRKGEQLLLELPEKGRIVNNSYLLNRHVRL